MPSQSSYLLLPSLPLLHRAIILASYHRIPSGLRVRSDESNGLPVVFGGIQEEGTYPQARHLLQGRMIGEIVRSQAPNKVLWAIPPPENPAEQPLPWSCRSALSHLCSGYCLNLQAYRHSVSWDDERDPTCPDCHVVDQTVANLSSCPTNPTDLPLGYVWATPLR